MPRGGVEVYLYSYFNLGARWGTLPFARSQHLDYYRHNCMYVQSLTTVRTHILYYKGER
jgi:hypothetical protein